MQVRQLVGGTGSEATASAWNGSRTRWAAGTADGALHIWERCDDGAERGPLSLSASWPLGGSGGGDRTATAAHVVWAPQEFGGKLAVACRGSSRVHIWGEVGGAGEGEDGRGRAMGEGGGDGESGGSGAGREERNGEERNREGGQDTEMGGGGGGRRGGDEAGQSGAGGGVEGGGGGYGKGGNGGNRWKQADVALFPYADVSMGKELLSRAIIAVHPSTRAFGQSPAVAIATCAAAGSSKGDSNTAKVWVRSDRYMFCHAIVDLLPASSSHSLSFHVTPCHSLSLPLISYHPCTHTGVGAQRSLHALACHCRSPACLLTSLPLIPSHCMCIQVWVRSDRYMHWHAIADLLPASSATTAANQQPPPVTSIAWAPTLDRYD
ncbi:unnamed protein product [Closterium sp. Naga37s-1]|nr:unnamed protein product [Closterium sp. Naga37s-1]